jgi:hypothetical protein
MLASSPSEKMTIVLRYSDGRPIPDEAWPECYDGGSIAKFKPSLSEFEWERRFIAETTFPWSESPSKLVH